MFCIAVEHTQIISNELMSYDFSIYYLIPRLHPFGIPIRITKLEQEHLLLELVV